MKDNRVHISMKTLACGCALLLLIVAGVLTVMKGKESPTAAAPSPPDLLQQRQALFRLIFTGNTMGYIDPCDCGSGILGGLNRRSAAVKEYRDTNIPTVLFDLGNFFETPITGPMMELRRRQARFVSDEIVKMGYEFIALGSHDLLFDPSFLAEYLPQLKYPALLTNRASDADIGVETVPRIRLELGNLKVDVFNVVDPRRLTQPELVQGWEKILKSVLEESENGKDPADLQMVIAHVSWEITETMPKIYPEIDLIFNGTWVLPRQGYRIMDSVSMTAAGKGQLLAILNISALPLANRREGRPMITGFQGLHVALSPDSPSDPEVLDRMNTFKSELKRDNLIPPE